MEFKHEMYIYVWINYMHLLMSKIVMRYSVAARYLNSMVLIIILKECASLPIVGLLAALELFYEVPFLSSLLFCRFLWIGLCTFR